MNKKENKTGFITGNSQRVNRYGDKQFFIELDDDFIQWKGDMEYVTISLPNNYTEAYRAFKEDHPELNLSLGEFKENVHFYDYDGGTGFLAEYDKYRKLITTIEDEYSSVDPSGGPYIAVGMDIGCFIPHFKGKIVKKLTRHEKEGYLIETEKK